MVTCQTAQEWIQASFDVALDETHEHALDEHLSTCRECLIYRDGLKDLHERLLVEANLDLEIDSDELLDQLGLLDTSVYPTTIKQSKKSAYWIPGAIAAAALMLWSLAPSLEKEVAPVVVASSSMTLQVAEEDDSELILSWYDPVGDQPPELEWEPM